MYHQSATRSRVKREAMDRRVKQESIDNPSSGNMVKDESDDEKKPLDNYPAIKQDGQSTMKRARNHRPKSTYSFNWADSTSDAKAKSRILGIIEIPTDQAGRVIEAGKMTAIYHINYGQPIKTFVVYDGTEVLARVKDFEQETAVYELAALYFGAKLGWTHPDENDLDISSVPMEGEGTFAVKITLMRNEEPKKRKGPSRR
ncbi:hypothetical protein PG997_000155 [Apiospora hydei]|uniref:Uncharacterized protein n=1 Tax=Apiospora hydei TaxID=1337664 RepID=A0ABR1X9T9_9PEZI